MKSLAEQRTAALAVAARYAAQAPGLSWQQKSRNADDLVTRLRLPNIGVAERALAIGKTQLGTGYVYGGTTPRGFDCSGLTQFAFAKAGAILPRTAAQQRRATRVVTSPQVGDLVFIGGRTPYHVGIYVGNNRMLHSPRPGKAVQVRGFRWHVLRPELILEHHWMRTKRGDRCPSCSAFVGHVSDQARHEHRLFRRPLRNVACGGRDIGAAFARVR